MRIIKTISAGSAALLAIGLAACGSSAVTTPTSTTPSESSLTTSSGSEAPADGGTQHAFPQKKIDELAALVPESISADGKLVIGTNAEDAPNEFIDEDGKTIIGVSPDLGDAVGDILGLKTEWVNAPFDAIIPGIQAGKYELGMAAFSDTAEREKIVDFVTYYETGTLWAVQAGNPKGITPSNACGSIVASEVGNTQLDDAEQRSKTCVADGKSPIDVQAFQSHTEAVAALVSGRIDAWLTDATVVGYAVDHSDGKLAIAEDKPYDTVPIGIALPKDDGDLAEAVRGAVQELIDNGDYAKILDKWGISSVAIDKAVINGASK